MSHPQPPEGQPTTTETERYLGALHKTALLTLVVCPVLVILPPRKLDTYTIGLVAATTLSANHLVRERTGWSLWEHVQRSRNRQETMIVVPGESRDPSLSENLKLAGSKSAPDLGAIRQRDQWKLQREKEIKEDLDEGKGIGDMIFDQVRGDLPGTGIYSLTDYDCVDLERLELGQERR